MDLLVEEPLYGPGHLPNGVKTFERGQDVQMTAGPSTFHNRSMQNDICHTALQKGMSDRQMKFLFHFAFQTFDLSKF